MPIILDVFGVVYTSLLNRKLIDLTDTYRTQGHKIYLASNIASAGVADFMVKMGLKNHVDGMFSSGGLGVAKPANQFYHLVTQKINETPENILFFDDSMLNVDGANAYGWQSHLYDSVKKTKNVIDAFLKDLT